MGTTTAVPTARLEDEAITIIREIAAECERPVLLFSGGKDSVVMLHLAQRAFFPARIPFPVMHVDTGHNFEEVIEFRDRTVKQFEVDLLVASVEEAIARGRVRDVNGFGASRNTLQTVALLDAIAEQRFDAVFGGARRDEERARAKERVVSHRDEFGQWDPKNQRPELWGLYNTRHHRGEHVRVFPLSNWTELDVWRFIAERDVELPSLYYAHEREVFRRDGMLMAVNPHVARRPTEAPFTATVRFRTIGDATCTAAVESSAATVADILAETAVGPAHRAGQRRGPTTASPRPAWRIASARAISDGATRPPVATSRRCTSPTSAASTTASPPSSGGCCTTRSRSSRTNSSTSRRSASAAATTTSTSPCSPTGLRAEREQGITIDVAYRYFSTPHRDFVIADCPGHVQYTRNMITGVSRADLAIVLVDARHGIVEQTRRHTLIAALLRIPRLVVAVNKMDLVDYDEQRFAEIRDDFLGHAEALGIDR